MLPELTELRTRHDERRRVQACTDLEAPVRLGSTTRTGDGGSPKPALSVTTIRTSPESGVRSPESGA